jgi:hypothetical protein
MIVDGSYLEKFGGCHECHERFDQFTEGLLMVGVAAATNLCKSLEDTDHARPVLRNEYAGLLFNLFIVDASGERG